MLVRHLEDKGILSPHQHGFRSERSTVTQMIEALGNWTSSLDVGENVDVVYFDFEKAFDRVNHRKLLALIIHSPGA